MKMKLEFLKLLAVFGLTAVWGTAWGASGTIGARPNPCEIPPGAHSCTSIISWNTQNAQRVKVFVRADGKKSTPEREFGAEPACERCTADWIEPDTQYVFTLVDFSEGRRGQVLGTVTVTAAAGRGGRMEGVTGEIHAGPNPCRIQPGKADCTTYLSWSSTGPHARVYVRSEGARSTPEREFGTGHVGEHVSATWIGADTRYTFTLVDFSSGSRGRDLASVVVTAIK